MNEFIQETVKILRDFASKQESLNSQSYGEFRDSFNKAFDRFEELMTRDSGSSQTKAIFMASEKNNSQCGCFIKLSCTHT